MGKVIHRIARTVLGAAVLAAALGGCANTLVFTERTKAAVSIDFAENPAEPVELTAGYKRTVVAFVPPKHPRGEGEESHAGEALSLYSDFALGVNAGNLKVRNRFIAGRAAVAIQDSPAAVAAILALDDLGTLFEKASARPDAAAVYERAARAVSEDFEQRYDRRIGRGQSPPDAFLRVKNDYLMATPDRDEYARRQKQIVEALKRALAEPPPSG